MHFSGKAVKGSPRIGCALLDHRVKQRAGAQCRNSTRRYALVGGLCNVLKGHVIALQAQGDVLGGVSQKGVKKGHVGRRAAKLA